MQLDNNTLMKDVLVDFLRKRMAEDDKVVVLDADLAKCSGTIALQKEYPNMAIDVGIAEANMASMAAGLASYGYKPVITSFAPFATRRIADQIMISICYAKQNVKIVGTDPGITAELNGGTHMPFEDIGMLRSIPDILIYEPTDVREFAALLPEIMDYPHPAYIRMHRKNPPVVHEEGAKHTLLGAEVLREGADVTIVASGIMVATALEAREELLKEGIGAEVICAHTYKPFDAETICASARKTGHVVTAENHNVIGALRSAVAEALCANCPTPLECVGVKEKFGEVGKVPYLRKAFNMESSDIVGAVKKVLAR